jgi:phage terminase large subunit GpA-like protein
MPAYSLKKIPVTGVLLFAGAMAAVAPRETLEVWEWAEKHVILPAGTTPRPGLIRFSETPYMVGEWSPLWAYRRYQVIDNIWAAQSGKTTMLYASLCYDIMCDPGPVMIVYPDQASARRRSKKQIQPIIRASLPAEITDDEDDFQLLEYHLRSCFIGLAWAGSPNILAGEPCKHVKLDEEGKFPGKSDEEADAKRLALRRTISYGEFGNSFSCTTPSLEARPGWRDWKDSTQCQCYVPCPKCGTHQVMYFSADLDRRWFVKDPDGAKPWTGGVKWDRDPALTREQRCASAYYECEHCGHHITNAEKNLAVKAREWRARNPKATRYASHLPSWYSPWVKFADVVNRWFDAYKDEEARHDFCNSDCAVPYEEKGRQVEDSVIKAHRLEGHKRGTFHPDAAVAYLTADVHDDHIRYRVRCWAPDLTTWGIEEGELPPQMEALDALLARQYDGGTRGQLPIAYGLIDARWRTDEVYQFCLRHQDRMWPVMGYDGLSGGALYKFTRVHVSSDPSRGQFLEGALIRVDIDDHRWKDILFQRLSVTRGAPGYWYVEDDISNDYCWQMGGEAKVERSKAKTGKPEFVWILRHANHALDVEKYQIVATSVFQLTSMQPVAAPPQQHLVDTPNPYL